MKIAVALFLAFACRCSLASAAVSSFSLTFFDDSSNVVGSGFYTFEVLPEDVNTSFNDLSGLDWSFDLPAYGISISAAEGDSTSRESLENEGVYVTTLGLSTTLRFFDDTGSFISHNDESASLRTSVRFLEFSDRVQYILDDETIATGIFVATLIPEPGATALFVAILAAGGPLLRRRR